MRTGVILLFSLAVTANAFAVVSNSQVIPWDGTTKATVKAASTSAVIGDRALVVTDRPDNVGTPTQTSVSCGTSTTTLLAAGAATIFLSISSPTSNTNRVWINVAGVAAVAAAPSRDLPPGFEAYFSSSNESFLPTSQINCIAETGATTLTLIYL